MRKFLMCVATMCVASSLAICQTATKPAEAEKPKTQEAVPALTPSEQFTMQDYDQQIGALYQQLVPLQQKRAAFVQALNASHPGYQWHDANRQGDTSGFVKNK